MLQPVALVSAGTNSVNPKVKEPGFLTCRACKTVQTFSIVFGIYFGIILIIHLWRWILANGNAHRRSEVRGYILTTLKIIVGVFLIVYLITWVGGLFGFVILSPHETLRGCEAVCPG